MSQKNRWALKVAQKCPKARNARIPQFIVVHGKGTGKLKSEIQNLVRDIKGAEMFDADYMQRASIIEQKYNIR